MSSQLIEMIELGCLLFIAAYHIILFFQIRRKYYLYLGLLVFVVLVRAILVDDGTRILFEVFPTMDRLTGRKIEFLAAYSSLALAPMFIGELFKFRRYGRVINFFKYACVVLMLFVLVTPNRIYRQSLDIYHLLMVGAFITIFIILYRAIKRKMVGAKYITVGVAVCFVFVFIEMLKNSRLTPYFDTDGPNLVNTGVLLYFFFQSIALSAIYAKSFKENERLNKELEERVSARTVQLSQANVVKDRYIQIVSHDLRSPLGNLMTMLTLVEEGSVNQVETDKLITRINTNLNGSLQMLDDLLEWTKVASEADIKSYKERINLRELCNETIPLFKDIAAAKGINLKFEDPRGKSVFVDSDKNALKVVLRNLITNSIKFSSSNDHIKLGYSMGDNQVQVYVSDTGIGIPNEMKETIFDMDSRNKRKGTGDEKSTGIGLALCKDLITKNDGEIWVEDNQPRGTIFKFQMSASS